MGPPSRDSLLPRTDSLHHPLNSQGLTSTLTHPWTSTCDQQLETFHIDKYNTSVWFLFLGLHHKWSFPLLAPYFFQWRILQHLSDFWRWLAFHCYQTSPLGKHNLAEILGECEDIHGTLHVFKSLNCELSWQDLSHTQFVPPDQDGHLEGKLQIFLSIYSSSPHTSPLHTLEIIQNSHNSEECLPG